MQMIIAQQNLNNKFKENEEYAERIIDELLYMDDLSSEKPHILLLSEFCYACQQETIIKRLENEGYRIFLPFVPSKYEYYKKYDGFDCVCMMAVKKGFHFEQNNRKELDEADLRYIEGTLFAGKGKSISMFFVHIPQATAGGRRLEYKKQMLEAVHHFWQENKDKHTFIGGDFNTEINGSTRMEGLFKTLYKDVIDTDQDKEKPTWGNKRFDYALVSDALASCNCVTKHLPTISDHTALITVFEFE